jgi:hypothetical protein
VGRRWPGRANHLTAKPSESQWCGPDVLGQCKSSGQRERETESRGVRLLMHASLSIAPAVASAQRCKQGQNGCMKRGAGRSNRGSIPRRYLFPFSYSSRQNAGGSSSLKPVGDAIKGYNSGQTKNFPPAQFCRGPFGGGQGRSRSGATAAVFTRERPRFRSRSAELQLDYISFHFLRLGGSIPSSRMTI